MHNSKFTIEVVDSMNAECRVQSAECRVQSAECRIAVAGVILRDLFRLFPRNLLGCDG